jgi:hypothetical protein
MVSHLLKKRSGMISNLLKRWRDDFATVKRQRDDFRAFRKETGCHPAPPQALTICNDCFNNLQLCILATLGLGTHMFDLHINANHPLYQVVCQ